MHCHILALSHIGQASGRALLLAAAQIPNRLQKRSQLRSDWIEVMMVLLILTGLLGGGGRMSSRIE